MPEWTEGVCGDGAAILRDGEMIPIENVLATLNSFEAACRTALDAYSRVSRVKLPGDVAGDLVHARETLRRALGLEN